MKQTSDDLIDYFARRFGVNRMYWLDFKIDVRSSSAFVLKPSNQPQISWTISESGFRVARLTTHSFKPTTRCIQWLGHEISKNTIKLTTSQLEDVLSRTKISGDWSTESRGFVALFYRDWAIGCGFWTGDKLRTQISKALSSQFPEDALA